MTLGIDNGVSGALALLGNCGHIVAKRAMPTQATRRGREVDMVAVRHWLAEHSANPNNTTVVIEEPMGSQSAKAAASMAQSFGRLMGGLTWAGYAVERCLPHDWRKRSKTTADKETSITKARELWPDEDWRETPRCKTAHDGMCEAALIAKYGKRER